MTNLRQGGSLRVFVRSLAACVIPMTYALLLPGASLAAAPRSHARRALPTPLHKTAVSESSFRVAAGKKRKGDLKSKANAPSAGAGQRKTSKGRKRRNQPAEDMVPMYHAERDTGRNDRLAPGQRKGAREQQRAWSMARGPAPLVSARRAGRSGTHDAGYDPSWAERAYANSWHAPSPGRSSSAAHGNAASPVRTHTQDAIVAANSGPTSGIYAEGVSRPADEERLPRGSGAADRDASLRPAHEGTAPIVRVYAAPSRTAISPPAQPSTVQGFGGEIAVAGPATTDRPGGTRRRNHPSNWTDPAAVQTEPLEEREAITEAAVSPTVLPEAYDGRLLSPSPLRGSHDVLVHQNVMGMNDGLERIYDDADLERLRAAHLLVSLPQSESLRVNPELPANRRVARPWTVAFASDLARDFYQRFGQPLTVTSAARTVNFQARLQRVNGNAAATAGEAASPHLTGQAVDFGKRGMSLTQLAWMRAYLVPLMQAGKIDVEEEFQQACFHISVYRSYAVGRVPVREFAQTHPAAPSDARAETPDER